MSLMPCFEPGQAHAEGIIIGKLLTGYGEIEVEMCGCLIAVDNTLDLPIKKIFKDRGAENRIQIGKGALQADFTNANLVAGLTEALADMDWCREIRNQYSHCQWYWTAQEGLCFVNLEELARQPKMILDLKENRHRIDVPLLQQQEEFFWYVKQCFMHLTNAYKAWDRSRVASKATSPSYPKPTKIERPPKYN